MASNQYVIRRAMLVRCKVSWMDVSEPLDFKTAKRRLASLTKQYPENTYQIMLSVVYLSS